MQGRNRNDGNWNRDDRGRTGPDEALDRMVKVLGPVAAKSEEPKEWSPV